MNTVDQYPLFITIVCVSDLAQKKAFVELIPDGYHARIALFSVAGAGYFFFAWVLYSAQGEYAKWRGGLLSFSLLKRTHVLEISPFAPTKRLLH